MPWVRSTTAISSPPPIGTQPYRDTPDKRARDY